LRQEKQQVYDSTLGSPHQELGKGDIGSSWRRGESANLPMGFPDV